MHHCLRGMDTPVCEWVLGSDRRLFQTKHQVEASAKGPQLNEGSELTESNTQKNTADITHKKINQ